jgi:integrase
MSCSIASRRTVLAFDTKQPRADENGEPLYVVQLIALGEGEAEIRAVKVPGMPSGIRQGHPVKVVSERLGHANIAITMDTYSHVLPGLDEQAAGQVARLILGAGGSGDAS